jgi:hypothetical protein
MKWTVDIDITVEYSAVVEVTAKTADEARREARARVQRPDDADSTTMMCVVAKHVSSCEPS